jgi:hypothetical protein
VIIIGHIALAAIYAIGATIYIRQRAPEKRRGDIIIAVLIAVAYVAHAYLSRPASAVAS